MDLTNFNKDRKVRRKTSVDIGTMVYGKVPPQARELEEAVLGAIMLEKSAFDTVVEILKPECFYVDTHQKTYSAFISLASKQLPIDMLTVVEELKVQEHLDIIGGPYYITKLTNSVVSTANIEAHARIVLQKFIQRELIRISGEIIGDAYEDNTDVFDLLDLSESKMFQITNNYLNRNFDDMGTVLAKTINKIEELRNKKEDISGVPSGFPTLDRVTFGWQPADLIILAARPAMGKTAFALNLARNAALHNSKATGVGFFSLEMGSAQLVQRILSAESELPMEKISRGKLEDHEMQQLYSKGINKLTKAPIYIDDTAQLNIFELRAKARRLVNKHNVGIIIIDYLQLMSGANDRQSNREQEISRISRDLKGLAKELQVPIIALSQLSRAVETRKESKIPQLSDLRESGAIEQDADMVIFLYRDEYYGIETDEMGQTNKGHALIKIAKHRNGSLETIKLRSDLTIQRFTEESADYGSNWKRIQTTTDNSSEQARLYIQKGSKMNNGDFEEGFNETDQF